VCWALVGLLVGCGPTVPAPRPLRAATDPARGRPATPDSVAASASGSSSAPATAPPAERPELPFRLAWMVPSTPWIKAVAIAPWGDVVSTGARMLRIHAAESGKLRGETATCFTFPGALGFVGEKTGALVCEDSIQVFAFPGAKYRGVRKLVGQARVAAFGRRLVAVGFAEGPVRLFSTGDWQQTAELPVLGRVSALGLSRDDRALGVGYEDGRIVWHDLAARSQRVLEGTARHAVSALAFSPLGRRLFAASGPASAVWNAAGGMPERSFDVVRQVSAARWLSEDDVATVGADGLLVLGPGDGSARSIGDGSDASSGPPVTLDLSLDGRFLCTGAPEGSLRCFAADDCVPSGTSRLVLDGRLVGHNGKHVMVKADAAPELPPVGRCAKLMRHVQGADGGLATSGWVEVGEVRIEEIRKDVVRATLTGPDLAGDGQKSAVLEYDTPVRLVWAKR
jgi:hypothetical protein